MVVETGSDRVARISANASLTQVTHFLTRSGYQERRREPGVLDFTFGDPHDPPSSAYVDILREATLPQDELWFAYKMNEPDARQAAARSLSSLIKMPFEPEDIHLTTGGFAALGLAMKTVSDPGDEIIYSLPPWFLNEALALEAGLVPIKVSINLDTFDLDLDAIDAAITPRTRLLIVNSPNNPTGRMYSPATLTALADILDAASERNGRRIFLISDEAYNRIVYDGKQFRSPVEFYPWSFLAYSYGKTLLAPGQRIGYLAVPPTMPERTAIREAILTLQISSGWVFPNAVLQQALPKLEQLKFDIPLFQQKRDLLVNALQEIGYDIRSPEGTFYLFPVSPLRDDRAFTQMLSEAGALVMPGALFETPGYFRISLTATLETIEAGIPMFEAAFSQTRL